MSRLRTDFYNDRPVEGDEAIADKDALTLDFVDVADTCQSVHFSRLARPSFGIEVAQVILRRADPGGRGINSSHNPMPIPNNAGHPFYHPRNCDTGGVCLQKE